MSFSLNRKNLTLRILSVLQYSCTFRENNAVRNIFASPPPALCDLLLTDRIYSSKSNFFPLRVDSIFGWAALSRDANKNELNLFQLVKND